MTDLRKDRQGLRGADWALIAWLLFLTVALGIERADRGRERLLDRLQTEAINALEDSTLYQTEGGR